MRRKGRDKGMQRQAPVLYCVLVLSSKKGSFVIQTEGTLDFVGVGSPSLVSEEKFG